MTVAVKPALSPAQVALAYHVRTKHNLQRYAAGPETLDWDLQPNPFREFAGCARLPLALMADQVGTTFAQVYAPNENPASLSIATVGALLELSMGLAAWKEYGPDKWALRCNPSSGNLHPTEAYVIAGHVPGLDDGLYHYVSRDHALEQRCVSAAGDASAPPRLWIGLSSIHWREAWKYGERAFRYCQLDLGHAIGAIRYAAAALGWSAKVVPGLERAQLAALMGLDRADDFAGVVRARAEQEDADVLIAIEADGARAGRPPLPRDTSDAGGTPALRADAPTTWDPATTQWAGKANVLDRHPMYRWPVINQVSVATQDCGASEPPAPLNYPPFQQTSAQKAAELILGRRSAQHFDRAYTMTADVFFHILDSVLARPIAPFDVWDFTPRTHLVLFVHRVDGLAPGLYVLPRHPGMTQTLRDSMSADFEWLTPENAPAHLPLFRLLQGDFRAPAKTACCHQAIASDSCFAMSMLSEFEPLVQADAWRYRQLYWETGLVGQALYLEAEAAGLRATGIGCYFDDAMHELLALKDARFQALYHFTVGNPLTDERISTLPAYPGRQPPTKP
jgi:SagB-type dehydrogenase family enzyme